MHREPIEIYNDDSKYEGLEACQNNDTHKDLSLFSVGSTVAVQQEDRGL